MEYSSLLGTSYQQIWQDLNVQTAGHCIVALNKEGTIRAEYIFLKTYTNNHKVQEQHSKWNLNPHQAIPDVIFLSVLQTEKQTSIRWFVPTIIAMVVRV